MSQIVGRLFRIVLAVSVFCMIAANAQDPESERSFKDSLEDARVLIRDGARQLLNEELMLTDGEKEKFWLIYNRYDAEMDKLTTRYIDLVDRYLQLYYDAALTDQDANELLDEYLEIQIAMLQVRQRYLQQFRRVMPGIKVARFYQIENKIRADVDAVLALVVPLADPS